VAWRGEKKRERIEVRIELSAMVSLGLAISENKIEFLTVVRF
jgi:hypothetical protein